MANDTTKRKVRYWQAYAVIATDKSGGLCSLETFRSMEDAKEAYYKMVDRLLSNKIVEVVMDGTVLLACADTTNGRSVRLVGNKVWKKGFEA